MIIEKPVIKNIYNETKKLYEYLKSILDRKNAEAEEYFDEPDICLAIRKFEGETTRYIPEDFYKCQISNMLKACSQILSIIYYPCEEPDKDKRLVFSMKYAVLSKINKDHAFTYKKLDKLIMSAPINPVIVQETEDFYNNLMEDVEKC
jgi:hypothetical protein